MTRQSPRWWARELFLGSVLTVALFGSQYLLDERRSYREVETEQRLATAVSRQENLRFVRERSSVQAVSRPFFGIDVEGQDMSSLQLAGADFRQATLMDARFIEADVHNGRFGSSNAYLAWFIKANLEGASFTCVGTQGCVTFVQYGRFEGANLNRADFREADLEGSWFNSLTTLKDADFTLANLSYTLLSGADFSTTTLTGVNLQGVCYNAETQWPSGFSPPKSADSLSCLQRISQRRSEQTAKR